jgi:secretion/DNA translocation related TadE-like protein
MKEEKGFATVFSIFMSLFLFSFCSAFVIVASVLSVKHKANHAAEEAALAAASSLDCVKAQELAESNNVELVVCNLENEVVYIETFARFKPSQIAVFSKLRINGDGVIGRAKAAQL